MARKTTIYVALFAATVAVAAIALLLWLGTQRAPLAARLLPEADAIVYLDLRPMRLAATFAQTPKIERDAEYDNFVRATGFEFERDLQQAAIAVHLPATSAPPASAGEPRFSEIFVGRFDTARVTNYFRKNARQIENYRGHDIFVVPVEGRTVRLALLSQDTAAVSNVEDQQIIRNMIDAFAGRWRARGPQLVQAHYRDLPAASLVWALAELSQSPTLGGIQIQMPADVTWVASIRYAGSIDLEAQAIARSENDAKQIADTLNLFSGMTRSIQANLRAGGTDPDVKKFFDSLQMRQNKNRVVLTAEVPVGFVKKLAESTKDEGRGKVEGRRSK